MADRPPLIQRPTYIDGASPSADLAPMVIEACRKSGPILGAVGGAALGATFAYFAPKVFDRIFAAWRERQDMHGEPVEFELDDE